MSGRTGSHRDKVMVRQEWQDTQTTQATAINWRRIAIPAGASVRLDSKLLYSHKLSGAQDHISYVDVVLPTTPAII